MIGFGRSSGTVGCIFGRRERVRVDQLSNEFSIDLEFLVDLTRAVPSRQPVSSWRQR